MKSFGFNIAFKTIGDWEGVLVALHASLIRAQCFYYSPAHFLLVNTINKNQITILIWCGCWCWWLAAGAGWAVMAWKFLNSLFSRFSCWAMINSSGSLGHYSAVRGHLTNTSIQQMKTSKCWCFNFSRQFFFVAFRPKSRYNLVGRGSSH